MKPTEPDLGERPATSQAEDELRSRLAGLSARLADALAGDRAHPDHDALPVEHLADIEARVDLLLAELAAERARKARIETQFGELVEVVTALASLDYSRRAIVYEGQDDAINALAIGLNMMCEELQHSTEELIRVRDEALAANRAKSAFLANMSHEFRTPLNAIIGYAELLCDDYSESTDPAMLVDLHRIAGSARHVLNLIQDTLDISKIEAEKLVLECRPLDLHELIDDLVVLVTPELQTRGNRLVSELRVATRTVLGDVTRLRQILLNLLSNANKFTSEGRITVTVVERAGRFDFSVADTGIGIPREAQESIFQAFTQADGSTTRLFGGTGLGLTISRRLCEMMGGTLSVTSEVGVGSIFVASLPLEPA